MALKITPRLAARRLARKNTVEAVDGLRNAIRTLRGLAVGDFTSEELAFYTAAEKELREMASMIATLGSAVEVLRDGFEWDDGPNVESNEGARNLWALFTNEVDNAAERWERSNEPT